ncbi:MAG: TatD family hydrolase, partial [Deltaproteobacteria bacterium]|nr:TatD family hydrolase [Deltaproteobacteria bacterium]
MNIIDTHSHLCDPAFDEDLPQVLRRAEEKEVRAIISVSENLTEAEKNLRLSKAYSQILPAAGLYPTELDLDQAKVIG